MAQHDFVIDNGPGLTVRTDINAALQALISNNSGPVEPTTKYAGMIWLDTTVAPNGLLRQRNQANNAWVALQSGSITQTVVTTSGTYTKSASLKFLEVIIIGGGGGAGNGPVTAAGASGGGSGGGGGGTVIKLYPAASLGASISYTVGAFGTSVTAGGTSTFSGLSAGGGGAGTTTGSGTTFAAVAGGASGSATGGDLNIMGGEGENGMRAVHGTATLAYGGGGGTTPYSMFRPGQYTAATLTGVTGRGTGGGGNGSANGASQALAAGGIGVSGAIILKEYF